MYKKEMTGAPRMHIRIPNANVVIYGVLGATVSRGDLEQAVLLLSHKHRLLDCHIETDNENKAWYVIDGRLSPIVNASYSKTVEDTLVDELKHSFDLEKGPLIRFTLLHQTETILIINCHHAICDGMSLVYLFNDIVRVLGGEETEIERQTPVFLEPDNIPQRLGNPITRLFIAMLNKKWNREVIAFSDRLRKQVHGDFWKDYKPRIVTLKLSRDETENLIAQCKQNAVSVNSGLVAAFLYAEAQQLERKDYSSKVLITDNLRNHLKNQPGESMGYFASTLRPHLEYSESSTFWENARAFHQEIRRLLAGDPFKNQLIGLFAPKFLDVLMLNQFGKRDDKLAKRLIRRAGIGKLNSTFTMANLGIVPTDDIAGDLKLQDLFGPLAVSNAMEKYISVLTINHELHISICFNESVVDQEAILGIAKLVPSIFADGPK